MLAPAGMTRISAVGPKIKIVEFIDSAYGTRALHVVDYQEGAKAFTKGSPLKRGSEASKTLMDVRKVKGILCIEPETPPHPVSMKELDAFEKHAFPELVAVADKLAEGHSKASGEKARLEERLTTLGPLENLPKGIPTTYTVGQVLAGRSPAITRKKIGKAFPGAACIGNEEIQFIVVPKKELARAKELLAVVPWEPIEVPETGMTIGSLFKKMRKDLSSAVRELDAVEKARSELKERHARALLALEEKLEIEIEKSEMPTRLGFSQHFFICDAWVPSSRYSEVRKKLEMVEGVEVSIEKNSPEEAPVTLDNPKPIRGYQALVGAFERPKMKEIDPTIFVAFTFPLFFGFMLGDVGYAVLMLTLLLAGVFDWLLDFLGMGGSKVALKQVLYYSAFSSFMFGIFYGEYFGVEMYGEGHVIPWLEYGQYPLLPLPYYHDPGLTFPMDRMHDTAAMITLCLLAGIVHLYTGWVLGLVNAWRLHGVKHAILSKGSWILIITGAFMWVYRMIGVLMLGYGFEWSAWEILGSIALAAGGVMAVVGEGPTSLIEIPMYTLSNSLSYTRLFAVGLSSVGIALAVNEYLAKPFFDMGGVMVAAGVAVLVLGHTVNFGLGMIGPGLHSLRLQYVEFFTKFFEGGGEKFTPIGRRSKYVTEII